MTPWNAACQAPLSMGFSGKNTGAGCHFLLQDIFPTQGWNPGLQHCRWILYQLSHQGSPKAKEKVTQLCPTLCDTMDYTVHGIFQARIVEWVAVPLSRTSSQPRYQTQVSSIAGRFFTSYQESPRILEGIAYPFSSRSSRPRNRIRVSCIAGGFFTS